MERTGFLSDSVGFLLARYGFLWIIVDCNGLFVPFIRTEHMLCVL